MFIRDHRQRLWLKRVRQQFWKFMRQPFNGTWGPLLSAVQAHPWSAKVQGRSKQNRVALLGALANQPLRLTIFMTPCCWDEYMIPLVQLGRALARRFFVVSYLGGHGGPCTHFGSASESWSAEHCARRFCLMDELIVGRAGPFQTLNKRLTPEIERLAEEWWRTNEARPILELSYKGLMLWDFIKGSWGRVRAERVNLEPGDTAREHEGFQDYLKGFVINYELIHRYLESERPDAVLVFNGFFYQERLMVELARKQGIRVVAHENSSFADRKIFDASGYVGNQTSVRSQTWPGVRERRLSEEQERRLTDYLDGIYAGGRNTIAQAAPEDPATIRRILRLSENTRLALLIGQVPFDTVMIYDLHAFSSSLDFISATIRVFEKMPEYTLVLRLHPLEAQKWGDRTRHEIERLSLPPNVRLVSAREVNTYSLMRMAEFGITATSQAGLEMLAMGKPLIVVGDAFYAGKGFTHDVPTADLLEPTLRGVAARPELSAEQIPLSRSFLYHVIFEHQIPYDRLNLLFPPESIDRIEVMLRGRGEA